MCYTEITLTACGKPIKLRTFYCKDPWDKEQGCRLDHKFIFQKHSPLMKVTPGKDPEHQPRCKDCKDRAGICIRVETLLACGHSADKKKGRLITHQLCEIYGCRHNCPTQVAEIPILARCPSCDGKKVIESALFNFNKKTGKTGDCILESKGDSFDRKLKDLASYDIEPFPKVRTVKRRVMGTIRTLTGKKHVRGRALSQAEADQAEAKKLEAAQIRAQAAEKQSMAIQLDNNRRDAEEQKKLRHDFPGLALVRCQV